MGKSEQQKQNVDEHTFPQSEEEQWVQAAARSPLVPGSGLCHN